jgi:pyrimidine deaminase RibD-like protein
MAEPPAGAPGNAPGSGPEATESDRRWLRQAIALSRCSPPSQTAFAVGAVLVAADGSVLATGYSREGDRHDHAEEAALAKLPAGTPAGSPPRAHADAGAGDGDGDGAGAGPSAGAAAGPGAGPGSGDAAGAGTGAGDGAGAGPSAGAGAGPGAGPGSGAAAGAGASAVPPEIGAATLYSSLEPCRYRASRPRPCAELIIEAGVRRVVIAWLEPPLFAVGGGAALLREAGVAVVEIPELAAAARAVNAAVLGG